MLTSGSLWCCVFCINTRQKDSPWIIFFVVRKYKITQIKVRELRFSKVFNLIQIYKLNKK